MGQLLTPGDRVRVVWSDGYVMTGRYVREERGFFLIEDDELDKEGPYCDKLVPCNKATVKIEVISEGG